MCLKVECKFIELIELNDKSQLIIHYNSDNSPILIEYWIGEKSMIIFQKV